MSSPLIQTATQAFMDKLVGDWAVAGTFQSPKSDGTIVGEATFARGTGTVQRLHGEETLVYVPERRLIGQEISLKTYFNDGPNILTYYRHIGDQPVEIAGLLFQDENNLQGSTVAVPSRPSRQFKISAYPDEFDFFKMEIITRGADGALRHEQFLNYARVSYDLSQK